MLSFPPSLTFPLPELLAAEKTHQPWRIFLAAAFLVAVPVFIQAPMVRLWPWLSLSLTVGWVALAFLLRQKPRTHLWGDLLLGFSWSWLAGSIYWGWLRWEPLIHLPIEAIGIPFALWGLSRRWGMVGNLFYLGSFIGTAITDIYFYLTGLIPYWRQVMIVDPAFAGTIFQNAIAQIQTLWGFCWAIVLVNILLGLGFWAMSQMNKAHWGAFAGAILSTILVDFLFWTVAILA